MRMWGQLRGAATSRCRDSAEEMQRSRWPRECEGFVAEAHRFFSRILRRSSQNSLRRSIPTTVSERLDASASFVTSLREVFAVDELQRQRECVPVDASTGGERHDAPRPKRIARGGQMIRVLLVLQTVSATGTPLKGGSRR